MPNAPALSAAPSESTDLVAAETDYETLTEALMQTRRGRWFLAEHARRCRQMEQADLLAALGRIERAVTESREPAGLNEMREQLGALARIEQTLAENREPPALAQLNEKLDALPRIEQALADYRDPPSIAELREGLSALPRIEQALADSREPPGISELRDSLSAVTQAVAEVRAEVIAHRPADSDAADRARVRDEEMLRLLQEQRERLDALADIWARAQTGPAAQPAAAPSEPQTESAKPEAAPVSAGTEVSLDTTPVMLDTPIGEPTDLATAEIAATDSRLDRSEADNSEPFGSDIPTSALLDQAVTLELDIEAQPAEAPSDEASPFVQPDNAGAAHLESDARVSDDEDEPVRSVAIDPVIAIIVASEGAASDPGRGLRPRVGEAAPEEPHEPEATQLPAWLVGAAPVESPAALEPTAPPELPAPSPDVTASAGQPAPELSATDGDSETAVFAPADIVAPDDAASAASPEPAPAPEAVIVVETEAELVLEFEADCEPEGALAAPPDRDARHDPATETRDKAEAVSTFEREAEPPAAPAVGTPEIASEPSVAAGPSLEPDTAEPDRAKPAPDRATAANPDVLIVRALKPAFDPHADVVWESPPDSEPESNAGRIVDSENEFSPEKALTELRRILGIDPNPPADRPEPASPDETNDAPACETLEGALASDVIEELPAAASAASASKPPAAARIVHVAGDPLDPVRALSEEERIALFS